MSNLQAKACISQNGQVIQDFLLSHFNISPAPEPFFFFPGQYPTGINIIQLTSSPSTVKIPGVLIIKQKNIQLLWCSPTGTMRSIFQRQISTIFRKPIWPIQCLLLSP